MDPALELETRRLLISATLTAQIRRRLGRCVPAGSEPEELLDLARGLDGAVGSTGRADLLRFDPPYPGVTPGPQSIGQACRLVLACRASDRDGSPIGVTFTVLISGRPPQVSVAPAGANIPEGWRAPADRR